MHLANAPKRKTQNSTLPTEIMSINPDAPFFQNGVVTSEECQDVRRGGHLVGRVFLRDGADGHTPHPAQKNQRSDATYETPIE